MAKGYTVLVEKDFREADFETFYEMFVRASLEGVEVNPHPKEMTVGDMMSQQQTNNSSGLLNLNSLFGMCSGSKKEMQASAAAVKLICHFQFKQNT